MDVKEKHVTIRERTPISAQQVDMIGGLFRQGLIRAAASLSEMVGHEITALDGRMEVLPLAQIGPAVRGRLTALAGAAGGR